METVKPDGHNPQSQPITVTLRNACRDYPGGGGVLLELLQNADDAGASRVVRSFNFPTNQSLNGYLEICT
jgi:sacsin